MSRPQIEHETQEEFSIVLAEKSHDRLFTLVTEHKKAIGVYLSFMERNGLVHSHSFKVRENEEKNESLMYILRKNHGKLVEGYIEVSPLTGSVYQVFETSTPEDKQEQLASYQDWLQAARNLKLTKSTTLHYALKIMPRNKERYDVFDAIAEEEIPKVLHILTCLNPKRNPIFSPITDPKNGLVTDKNVNLDYLPHIDYTEYLNHSLTSKEIISPANEWFTDLPSKNPLEPWIA